VKMNEIPPEPPVLDWTFSPILKVKCPLCQEKSLGFNWIEGPDKETPPEGMIVMPCGERLSSPPWKLDIGPRGNLVFLREKP
jgi:hypothetical protein